MVAISFLECLGRSLYMRVDICSNSPHSQQLRGKTVLAERETEEITPLLELASSQ